MRLTVLVCRQSADCVLADLIHEQLNNCKGNGGGAEVHVDVVPEPEGTTHRQEVGQSSHQQQLSCQ